MFKPQLKILCYVNHYYSDKKATGPDAYVGKSLGHSREARTAVVERARLSLQKLAAHPRIAQMDIRYCGFKGSSILPIDFDLSYIENPRFCVYESLTRMREQIGNYDYFLNVEDDIELNPHLLTNILEFDSESLDNQCFLPNRYEVKNGKRVFGDLLSLPGWTTQELNFRGKRLRVAMNAHASVLFLKASKFKYATDRIDLQFRGKVIGRAVASAYAHFHKPLSLFRSFDDPYFHTVQHLDHYIPIHLARQTKWQKMFKVLKKSLWAAKATEGSKNAKGSVDQGVESTRVPHAEDLDLFSGGLTQRPIPDHSLGG